MLQYTSRAGFPVDSSILASSGMLFGGSCEPFAINSDDIKSLPLDKSSNLRCLQCGGYWWPGCHWRGNNIWLCGLCGNENAIQERMPTPDELREFVMVYRDNNEAQNNQQFVAFFSLIDTECGEAFLDAAILAVASILETLPENVRFGLAVSGKDQLTIFEFGDNAEEYVAVTTKLRSSDGRFRVELKDSVTSLYSATCRKAALSMIRALNSLKLRRHSEKPSEHQSCIGRSMASLCEMMCESSELIGGHLFVFSQTLQDLNEYDLKAIEDVTNKACGFGNAPNSGGIGIDYHCVTSGVISHPPNSLRQIIYGSGGAIHEYSYAEIDEGEMTRCIHARCERPFIFRGMVKARCCPELSLGTMLNQWLADSTTKTKSRSASTDNQGWWLISAIKNAAISLLSSLSLDPSNNNEAPSSTLQKNKNTGMSIFLGKGLTSHQELVWSVSSLDPGICSLAFELDFTQADGLQFISYPKSMAVQIASTFVTATGSRFIRVETRMSEADRPIRSINELWQTMDPKVTIFLFCRLLMYSNPSSSLLEKKETVLSWCRKVLSSGCGQDRFQKNLGKPIFGLLKTLAMSSNHARLGLLEQISVTDLDKMLWPNFCQLVLHGTAAGARKPGLKLSLSTILEMDATSCLLLDSISDMILVVGSMVSQQDLTKAREQLMHHMAQSKYSPKCYVLAASNLTNQNTMSPFEISARSEAAIGKTVFLSFMLEDPTDEYPTGYDGFVRQILNVE